MSMTPDEIIAVVQAFKAGKEIEMRPKHYDTAAWTNTLDPAWDFYRLDYRVKPEPKPDVIRYVRANFDLICASPRQDTDNLCLVFDGATGKLKSAEVLP